MIDWSEAFGGVPIYVHARDEQWVQRRGNVVFWDGDSVEVLPGRTLLRAGIHFAGGTILHWPDGAEGPGRAVQRRHLPGRRGPPLGELHVLATRTTSPSIRTPSAGRCGWSIRCAFDVIYGAWWGKVVTADAKAAVVRSANRYLRHIGLDGVESVEQR